jgi:L-lysine 6-transaminase
MVRFSHILRIMDDENLVDNARLRGEELRLGLEALSIEHPNTIGNARGRGLMCAFDLPDTEQRDQFSRDLLKEKLLVVGCGINSIRFQPHLIISAEKVRMVLLTIKKVLRRWA